MSSYYPSKCVNRLGLPGDHPAEGRLLIPQAKPISHQCRACAQEVIDEYREKLGWEWSFEPYKKESVSLRYQEELTTRENQIRIGTKHVKVKGVEYPFIAVSDHWRPALLHESRLVWIHHYRAIKGLRPSVFKVYYAVVKVPYNRLPWTVDNLCFGGGDKGREFGTLKEAIEVALILAEDRERMIEMASKSSVVEIGRKGGLVKSEKKAEKSRANGIKGGRRRSFSALDMEEE